MSQNALKSVHVVTAPISGEILIARLGRGGMASAKVERTEEVKAALIKHLFHGMGDSRGVSQEFSYDDGKTWYELTVRRIDAPSQGDQHDPTAA